MNRCSGMRRVLKRFNEGKELYATVWVPGNPKVGATIKHDGHTWEVIR